MPSPTANRWCGLEPRRGHGRGEVRPVVIVSADAYNETRSPLVAIVPLTRVVVKNPLHVALSVDETGLPVSSIGPGCGRKPPED